MYLFSWLPPSSKMNFMSTFNNIYVRTSGSLIQHMCVFEEWRKVLKILIISLISLIEEIALGDALGFSFYITSKIIQNNLFISELDRTNLSESQITGPSLYLASWCTKINLFLYCWTLIPDFMIGTDNDFWRVGESWSLTFPDRMIQTIPFLNLWFLIRSLMSIIKLLFPQGERT